MDQVAEVKRICLDFIDTAVTGVQIPCIVVDKDWGSYEIGGLAVRQLAVCCPLHGLVPVFHLVCLLSTIILEHHHAYTQCNMSKHARRMQPQHSRKCRVVRMMPMDNLARLPRLRCGLEWLRCSRRRDFHSAAPPSPFSRCFNMNEERMSVN